MGLDIEDRPSDSPYIDRVWRSRSEGVDRMTSIATPRWDLVVWEQAGRIEVAIQGPESKASPAPVPQEASFVGISFALGTVMPHLPPGRIVDGFAELPDATRGRFWLHGSAWCLPGYDDAEVFVRRLVREGVLVREPIVDEVLRGASPDVGGRTIQRRFLAATGLNRTAVRQIERARAAAALIREGVPVQDVVHRLGYFDQPHLAHSLTRYVGRTATRLREQAPAEPLSLLYKTEDPSPT